MEGAATASLMEEPMQVPLTPITRAVTTGTHARATSTVITSPNPGPKGAKARTAYHDFLGLWKDADPDIPILQQAKAEYARLQ